MLESIKDKKNFPIYPMWQPKHCDFHKNQMTTRQVNCLGMADGNTIGATRSYLEKILNYQLGQ